MTRTQSLTACTVKYTDNNSDARHVFHILKEEVMEIYAALRQEGKICSIYDHEGNLIVGR